MGTPRLDLMPSAADRWTTCTASPRFILENEDKVVREDNDYNREGTAAHEVAAAFLQEREPDTSYLKHPIDEEMRLHGWNYMEYVQGLQRGGMLLVEKRMPLWYYPGRNAVVDAAVLNMDGLHVIDYKYGAGIPVSPERNLQATIYAKSIGHTFRDLGHLWGEEFPVTVHIYQPRGRTSEDAPAHKWETTWGEIEKGASFIELNAQAILSNVDGQDGVGLIEFVPSEKACQWCPAKGFCAARQDQLLEGLENLNALTVEPRFFPPAASISVAQFAAVLTHEAAITKWTADVKAYALQFMKTGGEIPGFKLVTSRGGNRYWVDPQRAAQLLLEQTHLRRDEVVKETTASPKAIEDLLGKNKLPVELVNLIAKPPGQPVIATLDDKRESAFIDGKAEFDVLPATDF